MKADDADTLASRKAGTGWWVALALVALAALLLRLQGIRFDLPYIYFADETNNVPRAFRMLSERSLDPHWFGHPGTPIFYLLTATFGLLYLALAGLGSVGSFEEFAELFYRDPTVFYLSARLWSAFLGVACVVALGEVGRRFFGRAVGIVAAVALATQPLTVVYSKMARVDTLLPFLALLGVAVALRALEDGRRRDFAVVGAIAGVAAMTKYPGALLVALVPLALLLRRELWSRRGAGCLPGSLAAFVVAAFVASPYFFLDPGQVAADLRVEFRPHHPGANGEGLWANIAWYLGRILDTEDGFGIGGGALVAVGVAAGLGRRSGPERKRVVVVAGFAALLLLAHAAATLRWARWMMPAFPFFALMLAIGLEEIHRGARRRLPGWAATSLALVALAATIAGPLAASLERGRRMGLPRTPSLLAEWILEHVPTGRSILVEREGVQLPADRYRLFEVEARSGRVVPVDPASWPHARLAGGTDYSALEDLAELDRAGIDLFVTSRAVQWGFRQDPDRYSEAIRRYDELLAAAEPVLEIAPAPDARAGPKIGLYVWPGLRDPAPPTEPLPAAGARAVGSSPET